MIKIALFLTLEVTFTLLTKKKKKSNNVVPCVIHKLDNTSLFLSLVDVSIKNNYLNLVPGQVGMNEIGQEFLWNDKFLYQTNYGVMKNGLADHVCLKVSDYLIFKIIKFKEDDFRKEFTPQFEKLFHEKILLYDYAALNIKTKLSIIETINYDIDEDFTDAFNKFETDNDVMKELKVGLPNDFTSVKDYLLSFHKEKSKEFLELLKTTAESLKKSFENYKNPMSSTLKFGETVEINLIEQ
jgi:hypothetical protein